MAMAVRCSRWRRSLRVRHRYGPDTTDLYEGEAQLDESEAASICISKSYYTIGARESESAREILSLHSGI